MSRILIKRSSTAGSKPLVADLASGELALNTYDAKLFLKKTVSGTSSIVTISNDYNDLVNAPTNVGAFSNDVNYITSSQITLTGTSATNGLIPTQGTLAFSSQYGVTVVANSNTITIGTPQDLRTTASPAFNGVTLNTITNGTKIWGFNTTGVFQLPPGGDIVDNHGTSVLGGGSALYSVRYDINNQGLTAGEQANARENMDAVSMSDAIIYSLIM
jgi:hypothetical protein